MCDKSEFEVCRLCLNSRGLLINVFGENRKLQIMLKKTIEDIIDVKVVEDGNCPWLVCSTCMEKLTEFRLFKRRCAECLSVFYNRIQKCCKPAMEHWVINREKFPGEIKKENDAYTNASNTVDSSAVVVGDDMIIVKEEVDPASEYSASPVRDIDSSMFPSMQEGCSHWPDNEEGRNLDYSKYVELHLRSDADVNIKELCDADMAQDRVCLREKGLHAQDNGQKQDSMGKDASGTLLHACQICYKVFAQSDLLKAHMMHVHLKKEIQFRCNVCWVVYKCENDLERHKQLVHSLKKKHHCEQCSRNFRNPKELRYHMSTHTGEWSFKCSICLKGFAQKIFLQRHMLIHTGERPHKCVICSKAFSLKGNLGQHMLIHTGEKRHKCNTCLKAFTNNGDLKRHMLTHTGERLYKCEICSKSFTQNSNLKTHMKKHTREKSFK
ncbi:zinc finger protein 701-like [Hetaerina americana]|uniref:zinc finger protein 701-like n=1 Tax=Hetaerina americana TaxID=62018 RepID=UPI003A7F1BC4